MLNNIHSRMSRLLLIAILGFSVAACQYDWSAERDHLDNMARLFDRHNRLIYGYEVSGPSYKPVIDADALADMGLEVRTFNNIPNADTFSVSDLPLETSVTNHSQKNICIPTHGSNFSFDKPHGSGRSADYLDIGETIFEKQSGYLNWRYVPDSFYREEEIREIKKRLHADVSQFYLLKPGETVRVALDKHKYFIETLCFPENYPYGGRHVLHFMLPAFDCDHMGDKKWRYVPEEEYILDVLVDDQLGHKKLSVPEAWSKNTLTLFNAPAVLFYQALPVLYRASDNPLEDPDCY